MIYKTFMAKALTTEVCRCVCEWVYMHMYSSEYIYI